MTKRLPILALVENWQEEIYVENTYGHISAIAEKENIDPFAPRYSPSLLEGYLQKGLPDLIFCSYGQLGWLEVCARDKEWPYSAVRHVPVVVICNQPFDFEEFKDNASKSSYLNIVASIPRDEYLAPGRLHAEIRRAVQIVKEAQKGGSVTPRKYRRAGTGFPHHRCG